MRMDGAIERGNLARTPFARVLADIWRQDLTGRLHVESPGAPKRFVFESGSLVVDKSSFAEKDFLRSLLTSGAADLISLARCEELAQEKDISLVRAILECALLSPGRLWALLESFVREEAYPFFDVEQAAFEFEPSYASSGPAYIRGIFLPALILEGIRRMTAHAVIDGQCPRGTDAVSNLSPYVLDLLDLAPHERYVLDLLDTAGTVDGLVSSSDLGVRETRRVLFAFLCLGIAGSPSPRPKTARLPTDISLADVDRLLQSFNAKCAQIFRYVSKEIGLVAPSVIQKALDELRGRLDPAFQGMVLADDGRIELKTTPLKVNMSVVGEDSRRSFLRSLDEILVAEVLAVRRTLGPAHESALVRSLDRLGEPA